MKSTVSVRDFPPTKAACGLPDRDTIVYLRACAPKTLAAEQLDDEDVAEAAEDSLSTDPKTAI